jgi:phosphoribosylformylglycinamidine cyclo-ligase
MARTYREAGVNLDEARRAVELIGEAAARTTTPEVLSGVGGFGSLFRLDTDRWPDPVLVASTDGVGTKLKIAIALDRHDTVGEDLVNHCVNDVAVQGADPLFFLDYFGVGRLQAGQVADLVAGMARACVANGVALVGGETAELPGLYQDADYDLAGFVVGVAARADLITGARVRAGDVLIGLPSTGLHTNGYSLARRIFGEADWRRGAPGLEGSLGDALLAPHRSYLAEMRALRTALREARSDVLAYAHITGGGWVENVPRTLPHGLGVEVESGSWPVPRIFSLLQQAGDIPDEEMVRTFNLGIGLTCVVRRSQVETALEALPSGCVVGRVVATSRGRPRVAFV